jgi:hypothetical protein
MRLVHLKAFQTPKIGLTGMETWIIEMRARTTERQTLNQICNWTMAVKIEKPHSSGMYLPYRM